MRNLKSISSLAIISVLSSLAWADQNIEDNECEFCEFKVGLVILNVSGDDAVLHISKDNSNSFELKVQTGQAHTMFVGEAATIQKIEIKPQSMFSEMLRGLSKPDATLTSCYGSDSMRIDEDFSGVLIIGSTSSLDKDYDYYCAFTGGEIDDFSDDIPFVQNEYMIHYSATVPSKY